MVFREVSVIEVREVLRAWLAGKGLRKVAEQAGVDRKTARSYVNAALAAGLVRDGGEGQLTDELVGQVVAAVRPARPQGHGAAWEALEGERAQIVEWVGKDLTVVKIGDLLARQGVVVPHRTLHRYCVERTDYRGRGARETVPVADGEPGVECQIDFARMGLIFDPETGRRRVVHALIFTAVYSRHMFVWLTFATTLEAVVAGCEAAWRFFGGVFKVLVPGQHETDCRPGGCGEPAVHGGLAGVRAGPWFRHRPRSGPLSPGQAPRRAGGPVRTRKLLRR